jgi:hypothetical protein
MVKVTEIQNASKEIFKYLDLYGIPLLFANLKKYPFVSWRDKSIPKLGSPTRLTKDINDEGISKVTEVKKLILHKNGMTTIVTNVGYLQFFACGQQITNN